MNEKLKELRHQAIDYCLDKGSQGNLSEEVSEKFAELIVQECVGICDKRYVDMGRDGDGWILARQIAEYFGVEE